MKDGRGGSRHLGYGKRPRGTLVAELLNLTELIPAVNSTFVAEPSGKIAPHPNKGPVLLLPMASKVVKSRSICRIVKGKIPRSSPRWRRLR
jgi:hypothetical protein